MTAFFFMIPLRSWLMVPAMTNFFSKTLEARVTDVECQFIDILHH